MLPLIFFYSAQLIMLAYALSMAYFQTAILKGMIAYWPAFKNPYTKPFHRFGWTIAGLVGGLCVVLQKSYLHMGLTVGLMLAIYSLAFDVTIGKRVYKTPWYLGTSAWHDRLFQTGKKKAIVLTIAIVLINAVPYIIRHYENF